MNTITTSSQRSQETARSLPARREAPVQQSTPEDRVSLQEKESESARDLPGGWLDAMTANYCRNGNSQADPLGKSDLPEKQAGGEVEDIVSRSIDWTTSQVERTELRETLLDSAQDAMAEMQRDQMLEVGLEAAEYGTDGPVLNPNTGTHDWYNWGLGYVNEAMKDQGLVMEELQAEDAATAMEMADANGRLETGDAPPGSVVFWDDQGLVRTGIVTEDGQIRCPVPGSSDPSTLGTIAMPDSTLGFMVPYRASDEAAGPADPCNHEQQGSASTEPASGQPAVDPTQGPATVGEPVNVNGTEYAFPIAGYNPGEGVDLHWGSHSGAADLFAPRGTPVVSMVDGTVTYAGNDPVGGYNVMVQGDDGNMYYYAHLNEAPGVGSGQRVEAGQPIGSVGDSGNAQGTGTHLHLGIGPSIMTGTGPAGGAGSNGFDAVGLLRSILGAGT